NHLSAVDEHANTVVRESLDAPRASAERDPRAGDHGELVGAQIRLADLAAESLVLRAAESVIEVQGAGRDRSDVLTVNFAAPALKILQRIRFPRPELCLPLGGYQ